MADYRDPKVTTTRDKRGTGTWIGIVIAAIIVIALIWWWWGGDYEQAAMVQPVEPVAPAAEAPVEGETAIPAQPVAPAEEGAEVEVIPAEPVQE